jgi:threonine dehydrogenase-like Zn-dependent dehydrogenase
MAATIPSQVIAFKGSKTGEIVQVTFEPRVELADDEIAIRVTHSGFCGTDMHVRHSDAVLG